MNYKISQCGWLPDLPDDRDHFFTVPVEGAAALPAGTDLRAQCPPVYDQGEPGSCTAKAIAEAVKFDRLKQKLADFTPSRLSIYYNERPVGSRAARGVGRQGSAAARRPEFLGLGQTMRAGGVFFTALCVFNQ